MYNVVIWGIGYTYNQYINVIKYQELLGKIRILGITGREKIYDFLDGYPFISIKDIKPSNTDYIIITSDIYFSEIENMAINIGFPEERILKAGVFLYPGFDFEKYVLLLNQQVSIIANNCWGGIVYHTLKMKFLSPFINMFEDDENYIRLLQNLRHYMSSELTLDRYDYDTILEKKYPVCNLGEIELHFNHYTDMEEVKQKWYSRCKRINWENLFVVMYTNSKETAKQFDELSYPKKICFVPFKSDFKSVYTLRLAEVPQMRDIPTWKIINGIGELKYNDFDLIDLLIDGEVRNSRCKKQGEILCER